MLLQIELEDFRKIEESITANRCMGNNYLITGATGFIGKYLVKFILYINTVVSKDFCHVYALCRNVDKANRIFAEYLEDKYFHLTIQDVEQQLNIEDKIDYIFHTAGISATKMFKTNPAEVVTANTIGSYNVLEFAKNKKAKGVLFFSSGTVYGKIPESIKNLTEEMMFPIDCMDVNNCYAESKRLGEMMCVSYAQQYKVPTRSVRVSHTYGPGIDLTDGHIYSDFVKAILEESDLVIRGSGSEARPFCYISEAVIAFFLIIFEGESETAYNLANSNETYSIEELGNKLVKSICPEKKLKVIVLKENENRKQNQQLRVDNNKLKALGWNPCITVEEGFARTVKAFEQERKLCK